MVEWLGSADRFWLQADLKGHVEKEPLSYTDRVLIMYGGRVMEVCEASKLAQARHPYTQGLLHCLPRVEGGGEDFQVLNRDPAWLEQDL